MKLPAPAKVNLSLNVTGIRADGYHLLDTSFIYVDACDIIDVTPADAIEVGCSTPELAGEANLAHRMLTGLRDTFSIRKGLKVHIEKRLPVLAGLGGGSSDAATVLLAANHIWGIGATARELIAFATPMGADIPCFLFGRASRATGVGDVLRPFAGELPSEHVVLAFPGTGLSTADVFAAFDRQAGQTQLTPPRASDTIRALPRDGVGANDLEHIACGMSSRLAALLKAMRNQGRKAWMSGSGTGCVAMAENAEDARRLARYLDEAGLADWTHAGRMLTTHPLHETRFRPSDWGVAKR